MLGGATLPDEFLQERPFDLLGSNDCGVPVAVLSVGAVLEHRFLVKRFIGSGGMGEVYEVFDQRLRERAAVKVLRTELARDEQLVERFRREIRLARRIAHPNICRVFDLGDETGPTGEALYFYEMELVEGETLAALLSRDGPLPEAEAAEIARQLASGLTAAHDAGIVHRDLKPANIILSPGTPPRAVITDFGLAVASRPDTTSLYRSTGLALGTPGYMAPEQVYGSRITAATDVYAYGIVLHELITGTHPRRCPAETAIPESWRRTIDKCMQLDPANRFETADQAYRSLVS